jgi:hypothetical protein
MSNTEKSLQAHDLITIQNEYEKLKNTVQRNFPSVWPQAHAFYSAVASLCFHDSGLPIALMAVGPSGSGKTEPMMWLMRSGLELVKRVDSFTAASFVSHSANRKVSDLEKNDLLPQIKDKCMCTKELAPFFAGCEDDLRSRFAQVTSVLDGEGLVTSSGSQGTRGYEEKMAFTWLGATTPPRKAVFNLMAQLGTRLFFFSTDSPRPKWHDYANIFLGKRSSSGSRDDCTQAVALHLGTFFEKFPIRSVSIKEVKTPIDIADDLGLLCDILSRCRGEVSVSEGNHIGEDRYAPPTYEHGWRAAQVLDALVKSSALIRGNLVVDRIDFKMALHICLSSMPEYRRKVLEAILNSPTSPVSAQEIAQATGMAKKTALHCLKELTILGVVVGEIDREPFRFSITPEYIELTQMHTPSDPVTPGAGTPAQQPLPSTVTENGPVRDELPDFDDYEFEEREAIRKFGGG